MHALALHTLSFGLGVSLIYIVARGYQAALERTRYNEEILADKNRQLQDVLTSLEERIADRAGEILRQKQFYEALVEHNPAFETLFGYTQDECLGKNLDTLINTPSTLEEARAYTYRILDGETIRVTGKRRRKDQRSVDVEISGVPVLVDGVRIGVLAMYHDVSERLQAEAHLKHLATHDPLTLLPNRTLFYDHLNHSLQLAHRNRTRLAVLFLDLDGFKTVNDLLGHAKGDQLLQQVAQRLKNALRKSDLVARLGGDEFAFVLENIRSPQDVSRVAEKILGALSRPFLIEGQELSISGSIGIALFPEDGDEPRNLLRHADAAMYRVKGQGKQHYQFFSWDGR
jgi:diguanylate cyclase (GGDEF)-like protein/PAS domain S-box-containing protein